MHHFNPYTNRGFADNEWFDLNIYSNNPNPNPNPYFVYESLICQCQFGGWKQVTTFSWSSNCFISWYQVTSRHLRYPSPCCYKLFFFNGYILPPSPAFSRFTWNLLLIVPRALLVIFRIKRANTLTQKYLVFAQVAQTLWEFAGL